MAPKKNKQREKQEQSLASSSARAHEQLLASTGNAGGFIGFSHFAAPPPPVVAAVTGHTDPSLAQTIYDGSDHGITLALKMLAKKGSVSKSKALTTLLVEVLPPKTPSELRGGMIGQYVHLYASEMRDQNDAKVRQLSNKVLALLCEKMKPRAFAPHLARLLPFWYMAMHDMNTEVAAIARHAFEALFPEPATRCQIVGEYVDVIMDTFCSAFFAKTAETIEGVTLSPPEQEERFERCVAAAVLSVNAIIHLFASNQQLEKLGHADEDTSSVAHIVSSDKFGRLVAASSKHPNFTRAVVRKATYKTLVSLCTVAQPIIQARLESFGKLILGILSDKTSSNHEEMWNAVLSFLQQFPSVWQVSSSFPKFTTSAVVPRLYAQLRHGFYGSASGSYPTLLPMLSMLPLHVFADTKSGQCTLYTGVLEQCWKFVESEEARGNEKYAITAYFECLTAAFGIFWKTEENAALLNSEDFASGFVDQYEKPIKASLISVLSSPRISEDNAAIYVDQLMTMMTRLIGYHAKTGSVDLLKSLYLEKLHVWVQDVLLSLTVKASFVPSRVNILIRGVVVPPETSGISREPWVVTSKQVYKQCVEQLKARLNDVSSNPTVSFESIRHLLELMNGLYRFIGLDRLIEAGISVDSHFTSSVRPIIETAMNSDSGREEHALKRAILGAVHHFFLCISEKKSFLLQLFQDFGVQYGDMIAATDIIKYALQFPITQDGSQLWLSCGSWQDSSSSETTKSATLEALEAIWKGKLLDEFLMISLKGRLDDLDADSFSSLLNACLGGKSHLPVVSPDAVVILSHFAVQQSEENNQVLIRVLPVLLDLLGSFEGELPNELASVEYQLLIRLFRVSVRGDYRLEAEALWEQKALKLLRRWNENRQQTFTSDIAEELNQMLVAETSTGVAFNTKYFATYAKKYLLLPTQHDNYQAHDLAEKLDVIHLRCASNHVSHLFYDRVLACLGELCEDERVVSLLSAYFIRLFEQNESEATDVVKRLVDIDVAHSLTWFVFHSDASNTIHSWSLDSRVAIVRQYLTLDHLYEGLRSSTLVNQVLISLSSPRNAQFPKYEHRKIVLTHQSRDLSTQVADEELTDVQHQEMNLLVAGTFASYAAVEVKVAATQHVFELTPEWVTTNELSSAQLLVASLFRDALEISETDESLILLLKECDVSALSTKNGAPFGYYLLETILWRSISDSDEMEARVQHYFDRSVHQKLLAALKTLLAPGSTTTVEVGDWITVVEYLSAFPSWLLEDTDDLALWEKVVRLTITHAIAGKQDSARVVALKIHKHRDVPLDITEEEAFVTSYPHNLLKARVAMLKLLRAVYVVNKGNALHELASHYREALLSVALCGLAESAVLKSQLVTTFVSVVEPRKSFDLIQLSLSVDRSLINALYSMYVALTSIHDMDRVKRLVLEAFGGPEGLAGLFDAQRHPLPPTVRVLLYVIACYSGVLQLQAVNDSTIDINADDEAATEAALAKSLIPKSVRSALELVFTGDHTMQMGRRKQKQNERDDLMARLLLWDLFLQLFPTSTAVSNSAPTMVSSALSSYASQHGLLSNFLTFCSTLLSQETNAFNGSGKAELHDAPLFQIEDLEDGLASLNLDKPGVFRLGARVFFRTVVRLPAMVRTWWNDECSRSLRSWAGKYFEEVDGFAVLALVCMSLTD